MSKYLSSSHTTYNIGYHVVFSPKYRYRLLRGASAIMLKELLLEKASNLGMVIQTMEVMPDYVHLFVVANPNMNIGTIVKFFQIMPRRHSARVPQGVPGGMHRGISFCFTIIHCCNDKKRDHSIRH